MAEATGTWEPRDPSNPRCPSAGGWGEGAEAAAAARLESLSLPKPAVGAPGAARRRVTCGVDAPFLRPGSNAHRFDGRSPEG